MSDTVDGAEPDLSNATAPEARGPSPSVNEIPSDGSWDSASNIRSSALIPAASDTQLQVAPASDRAIVESTEITTITAEEAAKVANQTFGAHASMEELSPEDLRETPRALPLQSSHVSAPPPLPPRASGPPPVPKSSPSLGAPPEPTMGVPEPTAEISTPAPAVPYKKSRLATTLGVAPPSARAVSPSPSPSPPAAPSPPAGPVRRATPLGVPSPAILDGVRPRASQIPVAPPAAPSSDEAVVERTLSVEMQEQLYGALRAGLDASLEPLAQKQKELEARLAELQEKEARHAQESERVADAEKRAAEAEKRAAEAEKRAAEAERKAAAAQATAAAAAVARPAMRSVAPSISVDVTPSTAPPPRPSTHSASFGYVTLPPAPPKRSEIEAALERVGPVDVPDFGTKKKTGTLILVLLVGGVLAAIIATMLSYS